MKRSIDDVDDEGKQGFGKVIAEHYNKLENSGLERRNESKIICMRNFNNWLKSMIIGEFVELARENCHANPANIKILDIGCGKGGDLKKYLVSSIQHLVCSDIAETSLEQCKDRYECMQRESNNNHYQRKKELFTCEFIHADATKDKLSDKFKNKNILFDLTMIQFAYHYSFESIEQATRMLENASRNLREGGYLVGTTVNANKIMKKTLNDKKLKFGNELFSIEFPEKALEFEKVPIFGNTYKFHLHGVVDCPEFLVHFPTVVHLAKKFNLELYYHKRFEDYFLENLGEPNSENRKLLQRMKGLKTYPLNEIDKQDLTDEQIEYEYEKANNLLKNDNNLEINERKRIGTISKSEWEAITLYMVFAFKKVKPIAN